MGDHSTDKIILTPKHKSANSTTLLIERKQMEASSGEHLHVAGGDHKGIIINKELTSSPEDSFPEISIQFRVFLVNANTGTHTEESRTLLFWFFHEVPTYEHASVAQEFFKELVSPQSFPRDYVGFIKMLMKLMQNKYITIHKLEVELKQLEKTKLPVRPLSTDESILGKTVPISEEKVLEVIESAYPNPVTVEDIAKEHSWSEYNVSDHIKSLTDKGLVKGMDHDSYTRVIQHDIQIVKQMPTIVSSRQPTIAIITAQYCEKLAVDAMMENKETFVRYTTVGESNVYTLGNIGCHRVVSTKLPTLGYTREAMTSAGNTTTRLLGTFQKVDYVFLVGVGGGVPHYTDYTKHVRLGDVVVSCPTAKEQFAYTYCETVKVDQGGKAAFECKNLSPSNSNLQSIAGQLKKQFEETGECPWFDYLKEGLSSLGKENEQDFSRPSLDTDKLYMSIGDQDVIEVTHPQPPDTTDASRIEGCPRLHLGPIASGQSVGREAGLRESFTRAKGALAFDFESDSVVESVVGNCRDSWALIRGIADYKDGNRRSPWQPFASLAASAVAKAIICALEDTS